MEQNTISEELSRNFHLFWDHFPSPVMLVRKDRTIIDRNRAAEAMGCIPGTRCIDSGRKEDHQRCLAGKALQEQSAKRLVTYAGNLGLVVDGYWIPLAGERDLYLHFFIDITPYAADRLFPHGSRDEKSTCGAESACSSCGAA
ncbi:hypothetical protein FO488_06060 [Geobacter sp. FeAm09]|nr:hypothetical protein FO488_06060 [Geobacter sp. FeAm09]